MKYHVKRPIRWKLILLITLPILIVYALIVFFNSYWNRKTALQQMKDYLIELTGHHAANLDTEFAIISQAPQNLAEVISSLNVTDSEDIFRLIENAIDNNPYIHGLTVAYEPKAFQNKRFFAPHIRKIESELQRRDLSGFGDYTLQDWYSIPALLGRSYWTEPYYQQDNGRELMCTFSVPVFKNGNLIAIAAADISLDDIKDRMGNISIMAGYTFLLSQHGTYIYHPNPNDIMKETIFSKAEKYNLPVMREFGKEMISGKSSVQSFPDPITAYRQWMVYTPISTNGWTLSAVVPENDVFTAVDAILIKHIILMITGLIVIIVIIVFASLNITRPIRNLVEMAEELSTGNLDVRMEDIKGEDEIHELAVVFNKMVQDLKHYIHDLTNATREKESVESELRIARSIQESLIPRIFPPFPDRSEFALFARNLPAKEVAGDFYDFFFLDHDNLILVIADVSGKGVSASLFMAVTKTLIKAKANEVDRPDKIMQEVNFELCQENDSAMFVTTFMAAFNVKTGVLSYCNAGHNPPYLIDNTGKVSQLPNTEGMALGVWEECQYSLQKITLQKNDIVFFYTDGINEAMDIDNNEFSYERLEEFLTTINDQVPRKITEMTLQTVKDFTGEAEQSDDITLMVLKYLLG